jgi:hypothetical protein
MGAVSAKYHLSRKIVDPACWRQYKSDMLAIRNLDGAPDYGPRPSSPAGGNASTRNATRVARAWRAPGFSHWRLAIEPAILAQLDGLARQFRRGYQPEAIAVVGRHRADAASQWRTDRHASGPSRASQAAVSRPATAIIDMPS